MILEDIRLERITLKKKTILELQSDDGEKAVYRIIDILENGEFGASCICYKAERIEENKRKTIVLKEFYPKDIQNDINRNEDGQLNISELINDSDSKYDYLRKKLGSFLKSNKYLTKYSEINSTKNSVCASDNTKMLVGNGSYYYENEFFQKSTSWTKSAKESDAKGDQMLQVALGSFRFLKNLHNLKNENGNGDALVDFKSQDVLIRKNNENYSKEGAGEFAYGNPLFYDFGSVLTLNQSYPKKMIEGTEDYMPKDLIMDDGTSKGIINVHTDNYTFARVIELLLLGKDSEKHFTQDIKDKLCILMEQIKMNKINDKEIEESLINARDEISRKEKNDKSDNFYKRKKGFNLFRITLLIITILLHLFMAGIMIYLCVNSDSAHKYIIEKRISVPLLAVILCLITFMLAAFKLLISFMSHKLTNLEVSLKYYDWKQDNKLVRTAEYNTFKVGGGRKQTTYQDESLLNIRRQRLRLFLWITLFLCIFSGLIISVIKKACPLFFIIGFISIIIFMYADALPSTVDFFSSCLDKTSMKFDSFKEKRAWYYSNEYYESIDNKHQIPFDLNSSFYINNNRNLYKIRNTIIRKLYDMPQEISIVTKLVNLLSYKKRNEFYDTKRKTEKYDIKFTPLIIRNIYKMLFDRMKNKELIITLSVLVVTLFVIFLDFVFFTGTFKDYFMIPDKAYPFIVISLLLITTGVSIYQILYSYEEEMLIADASYKSRFVLNFALNDFVVEDIAKGFIQPVDIVRGINQAEANVFTLQNNNSKKKKRKSVVNEDRDLKNVRLLHHDIEAYRRRLAITVWLLFGSVMSLIVWYLGIYVLLIPLIIISAIANILFSKKVIPHYIRKNMIKDIENLEKKMDFYE